MKEAGEQRLDDVCGVDVQAQLAHKENFHKQESESNFFCNRAIKRTIENNSRNVAAGADAIFLQGGIHTAAFTGAFFALGAQGWNFQQDIVKHCGEENDADGDGNLRGD